MGSNNFQGCEKIIKKKEEELQVWQNKEPDHLMLENRRAIVAELDDLNRLHVSYWYARAGAKEMWDGDKNTSYFHHKVSHRKRHSTISKLRDVNGEWHDNMDDISKIISDYFSNIFSSSSPSDFDLATACLSSKVSQCPNDALTVELNEEEIHEALFRMHPTT